jgi:hypothetical protein
MITPLLEGSDQVGYIAWIITRQGQELAFSLEAFYSEEESSDRALSSFEMRGTVNPRYLNDDNARIPRPLHDLGLVQAIEQADHELAAA